MIVGPDLTLDDVRAAARALGITIADADLPEVTYRFTALLAEVEKLDRADLSMDPNPLFGSDDAHTSTSGAGGGAK